MNKVLVNEFMKQNEEINKRAKNVLKTFGKITDDLDLKRVEEVMNTRNQHLMTTMHQFLAENKDIPRQVILDRMQQLEYMEILDIDKRKNRAVICIKPYTDIYLKPTNVNNGYFDYSSIWVISNEAVEVLQKFCNDYRLKKEGK